MDDIRNILIPLVVSSIIGLVKMYADYRALKAQHESLQAEVNELKADVRSDFDKVFVHIDKRFDKFETAIEELHRMARARRSTDFEKVV